MEQSGRSVLKFFRFLEVVFWIVSCFLLVLSLACILYQLAVLFIPFWWSKFFSRSPFEFPHYFFRVYGDSVADLTFEHYGYLLSATAVSGIAAFTVIPNHPWKTLASDVKNKSD